MARSPSDEAWRSRWRWSITPFSIAGMPLRIHVSTLVVLLMLRPYTFSLLAWLTWIAMVALHEVGHGVLVRREGGRVVELAVHGLGGECSYVGVRSQEGVERVAWGGVLAQALLFVVVGALYLARVPIPAPVVHVALGVNLSSIVFNLIPIAPLDGAYAWPLLGRWWRRARQRRATAARAKQRAEQQDKQLTARDAALDDLRDVRDTREADEVIARVTGIPTDADR
ncbi:MAG: hypothetical protein JNK05_16350 [Myxococcales bacterium]|nr:hypothetical protein [Myxococcales bacterium]